MWEEDIGKGGARPKSEGTDAGTDVGNRVCRVTEGLAVHDVDGRRRMAGREANMRRDGSEKPMSGTACVV